ncbi:TIGR04222 domain-containing membrane protein [Streptomyces sp. WMMC500]|uniref:TIGR04222 domain-containing membrane protein n=1 Tax=Streptomyces sp. WMMC500 TaxID=3015154 RepID=UPI00248BD25C|nr:TIGR04222 domain-containing membrane protein [Streptomyces sp. WMMC500]WBB62279.1 TIGR04222 domain-containing membrane protein [Streptomyces sp. WMMC500]
MWVCFALVAWAAALLTCGRLVLVGSVAAAQPEAEPARVRGARELTLYEAAFLAGGPQRVVDVTLVSLARERRLLLAHTGWATVVESEGRDPVESAVIAAAGPGGQSTIPAIRAAACSADALRDLDDGLAAAGLAVPAPIRSAVRAAVRHVRVAGVVVLGAGTAALALRAPAEEPIAGWFVLPLILVCGCLAIARLEVGEYTRWATPDGRGLLATLDEADSPLTGLAVRGPAALPDPEMRAALAR